MFWTRTFFFLFGMFCSAPLLAIVTAREGVLDLRGVSLDRATEMRGDWEFHWQTFKGPDAFLDSAPASNWIPVPKIWTFAPQKYPTFGYATYRLKVLMDQPQKIAVYFPAIYSASKIFVDGQEIASFGQLGTSPETSVGGLGSKFYSFVPKDQHFDIVIQVANYEIFVAGMTVAPSIGDLEALNLVRYQKISTDMFIIGSLFIMGIYHICLFGLRRSDPSTLFFGLMCLAVATHLSVSRDGVLMVMRSDIDFVARLRTFNISWMISVPMFCWFAYFTFRAAYARQVSILMSAVALLYTLVISVTHPRFFVSKAMAFQGLTVIAAIYLITTIFRGWQKKQEGAGIFLSGLLLLVIGLVVDMLAIQGYIYAPPVSGLGLFSFIFFQSYLIARRFSQSFKRIKISEKAIRRLSDDLKQEHNKVKDLNTNLERLVEEKTRDIRSIMEHIPLGIFMIKADFSIHKDHSRYLSDIFQLPPENLDKSEATNLLFEDSSLSSDARSQAVSALHSTLGESALNFEVNAHTLPVEIEKGEHPKARVFDLTWNPIEGAEARVDKVLVTMRDVTELRKLQARSRDQQEELEFIGEILNISTERFLRFIQSCQNFIQENDRLIHTQGMQKQNIDVLKVLFINMHTIKGAARSLYFKKMTQVFHDVEQYYASLQKDSQASWDLKRMENDLKEAAKVVSMYEKIAREKLGRTSHLARHVEFPCDWVETLYRDIKARAAGQKLPAEIQELFGRIRSSIHARIFKSAAEVIDDLVQCLPVLARDLHKDNPQVEVDTQGLLLSEKGEELLRHTFVHILRNSMDHGIETAEERLRAAKAPQGLIQVRLERKGERLHLTYRDDGRGLPLAHIRELGLARGLLQAQRTYQSAEIAELIFDSGLSTANQLTDISGRGVGMDAVRRFVVEVGGTIQIELGSERTGRILSFQFRMDLPFQLFEIGIEARTEAA